MTKLILFSKYLFIFLVSTMSLFSCINDNESEPDPVITGEYTGILKVYSDDSISDVKIFNNEGLEIFRTESTSALLDFVRSTAGGITVFDYDGEIINEGSILINTTPNNHAGQASLSDDNISVLIKNIETGLKVIEYNGTKI